MSRIWITLGADTIAHQYRSVGGEMTKSLVKLAEQKLFKF
ncbi:small, acid-soluble spore protein, alpha/beta type [Brevibacillus humidisoli]